MDRLRWFGWCFCFAAVFSTHLNAQVLEDPIQKHLDARHFDDAVESAELHPKRRDQLLGRIALAQVSAGDRSAAKHTLRRIADPEALTRATGQLKSAAGGANGADFDSLIDLITNTVAPESWDTLGGDGTISEFPGGVFVDSKGVLHKAKHAAKRHLTHANALDLVGEQPTQQPLIDDARASSELRMVSLPRLQRELQLRIALGEVPTESMRHLAGLQQIRYLFIFPETNDCVVAGPASDWADLSNDQSPLLLDDLLTLMKNTEEAGGQFGCNITPKQRNLANTKRFLSRPTGPLTPRQTKRWVGEIRSTLGLQDIEVGGVDPASHVAHVLVEADYHMKLVGMGLEPSVPGVPSYLESIAPKEIPEAMEVLRWWFTLKPDAIRIRSDDRRVAFVFSDQVVRLQSENERIRENGERVHTGKSSLHNQQFARRFTKHFDSLASRHPLYKRLDDIFRLALVAAIVHDQAVTSQIDWDPSWLTAALKTASGKAPAEVSSIVNHRVVNRRHVLVGVSGGVRVNAKAAIAQVQNVRNPGTVTSDFKSAKPRISRSSERWWWD